MLQDTSLVYVVGLRDFFSPRPTSSPAATIGQPSSTCSSPLVFLVICFSASRLANRLRRRYRPVIELDERQQGGLGRFRVLDKLLPCASPKGEVV